MMISIQMENKGDRHTEKLVGKLNKRTGRTPNRSRTCLDHYMWPPETAHLYVIVNVEHDGCEDLIPFRYKCHFIPKVFNVFQVWLLCRPVL